MAEEAVTHVDLESAIMHAEGAAAVLTVLQNELVDDDNAGWKALGLTPRKDLRVTALNPLEDEALQHASIALTRAVKEVSRVFYAYMEGRAQRHDV